MRERSKFWHVFWQIRGACPDDFSRLSHAVHPKAPNPRQENAKRPVVKPGACGGSCRIRTCGPGLKRPLLYRAELMTHA